MVLITQGNSLILPAHWEGGARASIDLVTAKNPVRPSGGAAEGGGGGNSAAPERIQKEASPAALLVQSRTQQKSFLFLLEEKIRRAQNEKSKEHFSVVWRACRAVAGLSSLLGVLLKKSSNINQKTPPIGILQEKKLNLAARNAPRADLFKFAFSQLAVK